MKIHWCDESSKCDKKFFIVMKFHHSTVMKNQHWDMNWWIWWKLIDMMKSLDCDNISHWDNNSSLWWKVFKGMKINPSIWREQIDVMKVNKCDENRSNTMKIHQSNVNSMIWWKCIYKMRIHNSDKKSTNLMEIQLFDKNLSL